MQETQSRFFNLMQEGRPVMEGNKPKNGSQFVVFYNKFGYDKINCILNWKDGFLNSDGDIPAVQMEDGHTEYWINGKISNNEYDDKGYLMPAIYTDCGRVKEYWNDGVRINKL